MLAHLPGKAALNSGHLAYRLNIYLACTVICFFLIIISADLDPSRVCKGKGVVTLRATLVHIDDEDCVSAGPDVTDTPSKCEWVATMAL